MWRSQRLKLYWSFRYILILSGLLKECLLFYPHHGLRESSPLISTSTCLLLNSSLRSTHQIRESWGSVHGRCHWWLQFSKSTWVSILEGATCCYKALWACPSCCWFNSTWVRTQTMATTGDRRLREFNGDEALERRFSGSIVGVGDAGSQQLN